MLFNGPKDFDNMLWLYAVLIYKNGSDQRQRGQLRPQEILLTKKPQNMGPRHSNLLDSLSKLVDRSLL